METFAAFSGTLEAGVNRGATTIAIDAGAIFTPMRKYSPGRILIEGKSIREVGPADNVTIPEGTLRLDCLRLAVVPGFIDPHIHGAGGADVMDGTVESLNRVSQVLAQHGTTTFLPTTVSSPSETLTSTVEKLGALMSSPFDGAIPVGIHLEGPFINAIERGTHKPSNITAPDVELFERWVHVSKRSVRLLTMAPELEGADTLCAGAQRAGVTVAMGHSNASFEEASAAANRGICYAVHTFNAMRPFSHRDPGIVGEVLSDDRIFAEIIADGIHVDRHVVEIFARAKGRDRVLLVTDAISATGMPDGHHRLGPDTVEVINGVCRDREGRLAGSTLTQDVALRNFVNWTGWAFEDALLGLTLNPARALKLDKKGSLEPGNDADIVVLDSESRVVMTFVGGRMVYERKGGD
jgi:N-acetylglucosamine-6-phosphate deacetylase